MEVLPINSHRLRHQRLLLPVGLPLANAIAAASSAAASRSTAHTHSLGLGSLPNLLQHYVTVNSNNPDAACYHRCSKPTCSDAFSKPAPWRDCTPASSPEFSGGCSARGQTAGPQCGASTLSSLCRVTNLMMCRLRRLQVNQRDASAGLEGKPTNRGLRWHFFENIFPRHPPTRPPPGSERRRWVPT